MKKLTQEYTSKSQEELKKQIEDLNMQIAKLEIEKKAKPAKDTNAIHKLRKRIAVIRTVIRQQELGILK